MMNANARLPSRPKRGEVLINNSTASRIGTSPTMRSPMPAFSARSVLLIQGRMALWKVTMVTKPAAKPTKTYRAMR